MGARAASVVVPVARLQMGEITWRRAPERRMDRKAPTAMPPTTATCHQFLAPHMCEARYLISATRLSKREAMWAATVT